MVNAMVRFLNGRNPLVQNCKAVILVVFTFDPACKEEKLGKFFFGKFLLSTKSIVKILTL